MGRNEYFLQAVPVWMEGKETEYNFSLGFAQKFEIGNGQNVEIAIAASSIYRVFLNGTLLGYGPARAAHGYYRVDCYRPGKEGLQQENVLAVEVLCFNVNSFSDLDQPAFLQAEVRAEGRVLLATGGRENGIPARRITDRLQKVQRYSFQRPFIEAYRLEPDYIDWRTMPVDEARRVALVVCKTEGTSKADEPGGSKESCGTCELSKTYGEKKLLDRHVAFSERTFRNAQNRIAVGEFGKARVEKPQFRDRSLTEISSILKGYPEQDLELCVTALVDRTETVSLESCTGGDCAAENKRLEQGQFAIYDMGRNTTGMFRFSLSCKEKSHVIVTFDEVLDSDGDVNYSRMGCANAISLELAAGEYEIELMQPYTCRYLKPMIFDGEAVIREISIREYKNPDAGKASFACSDPVIEKIFEAGRETFAQNAVDIYMDCPSRERAGWLCDSFFTGRVEPDLTGDTRVEDNFLTNYLLPETFEFLPEGMPAMCYPSDHNDKTYIPNWAMWLVLELEEYAKRNPNQDLIGKMYGRVKGILDFLSHYENEDGLLENLESWVFLEWSRANELTGGVNYPSNMLYAGTLAAAGRLYQDKGWLRKADEIRETIRNQSFDGTFFRDHAIRENGVLQVQEDTTEVCQYYAFMFETADRNRYPQLFSVLMNEFGPKRDVKKVCPSVAVTNAFIGNYLRIELLSASGDADRIIDETRDFFSYMADRTGTLWENTGAYASCNHGFASHVIHCYYRDLLGVKEIDRAAKKIYAGKVNCALDWCKGRIPIGEDWLTYGWKKENGTVTVEYELPQGYEIAFVP